MGFDLLVVMRLSPCWLYYGFYLAGDYRLELVRLLVLFALHFSPGGLAHGGRLGFGAIS